MTEPTATPPSPDTVVFSGQTLSVEEALRRVRSAGSWFWWLAALSLINTFATLSGSSYGMVLGLGYTQVVDALFAPGGDLFGSGGMLTVLHLGLVLAVAGAFVLFGAYARRYQAWAFVAGLVAYVFDTLIFLLAADWIAVGFHAFVLFIVFSGYRLLHALSIQGRLPVARV